MTQEELQQKYLDYQKYEEHLKKLQDQHTQLDEQLLEIEYIKKSIDELTETDEGKEMLCPMSNGVFVKGKIQKPDHFLVNVGENVVCKKSPEETKQLMDKQKEEMENNKEHLKQEIQNLQANMQELEQHLQKLTQD